ncbi:hypothetical protein HKX48_005245 [Thoreauomyces humboldtii]|nr:hypothetical protein HKX48_005245 [Thoreauomyces humboldtii]
MAGKPSAKRKRGAEEPYADLDATCFMCSQPLPTDPDEVASHIDACLSAQASLVASFNEPPPEAQEEGGEGEWEEYEWAGQTRVRASAMLEGGFAASGFAVHKKTDQDTDEELDIDDDGTEEFGESQYHEGQLDGFRPLPVNDDEEAAVQMVAAFVQGQAAHADAQRPITAPGDVRLVIDSLKSRIRDLEKSSNSTQKCLICLDPYSTPLVSVVCWHVHCEQLSCLASLLRMGS